MRALVLSIAFAGLAASLSAFAPGNASSPPQSTSEPLAGDTYGLSADDLASAGIAAPAAKHGAKWCGKHPRKCAKKGGVY